MSRRVLQVLAVVRVLTGVAGLVARPAWLTRLFGPAAAEPLAHSMLRLAAVRDVALGAGAIAERRSAQAAARLAGLAALCDATDALVIAATPGIARRARALTVTAGSAAALAGAVAGHRVRWGATSA